MQCACQSIPACIVFLVRGPACTVQNRTIEPHLLRLTRCRSLGGIPGGGSYPSACPSRASIEPHHGCIFRVSPLMQVQDQTSLSIPGRQGCADKVSAGLLAAVCSDAVFCCARAECGEIHLGLLGYLPTSYFPYDPPSSLRLTSPASSSSSSALFRDLLVLEAALLLLPRSLFTW